MLHSVLDLGKSLLQKHHRIFAIFTALCIFFIFLQCANLFEGRINVIKVGAAAAAAQLQKRREQMPVILRCGLNKKREKPFGAKKAHI